MKEVITMKEGAKWTKYVNKGIDFVPSYTLFSFVFLSYIENYIFLRMQILMVAGHINCRKCKPHQTSGSTLLLRIMINTLLNRARFIMFLDNGRLENELVIFKGKM